MKNSYQQTCADSANKVVLHVLFLGLFTHDSAHGACGAPNFSTWSEHLEGQVPEGGLQLGTVSGPQGYT